MAMTTMRTMTSKASTLDKPDARHIPRKVSGASGWDKTALMLKATPKATGGTHGGRRKKLGAKREPSSESPPTLAELDLTKKLSSVGAETGRPAPEHFEQVRENKVSVAKAVRQVEHAKRAGVGPSPGINFQVVAANGALVDSNAPMTERTPPRGRFSLNEDTPLSARE